MSEYGICDKLKESHKKCEWRENWRSTSEKKEKPLHAVGVSVLLIEDGKILLGRRGPKTSAAQGYLSTPGGRLEIEETFTDCALREFKEETGAELVEDDLRIVGIRKHFRFGQHYVMIYILATQHDGEIGNPEGDEKCEGGWQWFHPSWLLYDPQVKVTEPLGILHSALAEAIRRKASL